ncbi:hypothetical protein HDU88_007777 [Geranomyces variabilis]|nr:hypothetical protein HDU88_007777 [Geranomyces variabilis]
MKPLLSTTLALLVALATTSYCAPTPKPPARNVKKPAAIPGIDTAQILPKLVRANDYFIKKTPNPALPNQGAESNAWTRGVYYEGLMALYAVESDARFLAYTQAWGNSHHWLPAGRDPLRTRSADDQVCGQTYLTMYDLAKSKMRLAGIKRNIDQNMATKTVPRDWWWIDAIQMALPLYTHLGVLTGDSKYHEYGHKLFTDAKVTRGLWNAADSFWWRDATYVAKRTAAGKKVYWSRGNCWVVAAMVRTLERLPKTHPHRAEYEATLVAMLHALAKVQRADGFWNVNLADASDHGGRETSGTALHLAGFAYAIRTGLINRAVSMPVVTKAWNAIAHESITASGFLAWVQGVGTEPASSQPVTATKAPKFEDFALGCVLLAGAEVYKLAHM